MLKGIGILEKKRLSITRLKQSSLFDVTCVPVT